MLKVLVADDERIARNIIALLLKEMPDVGQIIEAEDGVQALAAIEEHNPDIIFLDIQMPGQTGIQLAEKLGSDSVVIFVTAYDEYAVNAFELSAVDYLLKPFEDTRFFEAMERAKRQLHNQDEGHTKDLETLVKYALSERKSAYKSKLVVKEPGRIRLIDAKQINYIAGAGNYAEVHLFDGSMVLHRETLTTLEQQLDPALFVRIHRSTIVRRNSIIELRPNDKGDYAVLLKDGARLTLSRRNKHKLADFFH